MEDGRRTALGRDRPFGFAGQTRRPSAHGSSRVNPRGNIFPVSVTDTSAAAEAIRIQVLGVMPGEQRVLLALEMSLFARELAKARIGQEHPEWKEAGVARELLRLAFLPASLPAKLR